MYIIVVAGYQGGNVGKIPVSRNPVNPVHIYIKQWLKCQYLNQSIQEKLHMQKASLGASFFIIWAYLIEWLTKVTRSFTSSSAVPSEWVPLEQA